MPEWSNGTDSKSVVLFMGTVGSNPTLSATSAFLAVHISSISPYNLISLCGFLLLWVDAAGQETEKRPLIWATLWVYARSEFGTKVPAQRESGVMTSSIKGSEAVRLKIDKVNGNPYSGAMKLFRVFSFRRFYLNRSLCCALAVV